MAAQRIHFHVPRKGEDICKGVRVAGTFDGESAVCSGCGLRVPTWAGEMLIHVRE